MTNKIIWLDCINAEYCWKKNLFFGRCPEFLGLPPSCTLIEDPNDRCCKIPDCPANVNGTQVIVPVPQYGPGFSGYGKAQYTPTGSVQPGQTSFTGTGTGTGPTVVAGTRSMYLL